MYKKHTLKNGLRVVTANMPNRESISIGIWIGVGGRYEKKPLCGMSHLIEHMLFKGTPRHSANALKESIEGVGGSFNGFTSEEETCFLVKLPSAHAELGFDILSDMVLNPKLDPQELEKEKYVICEEIKMYMDQPSHHIFDILDECMWPNHALGRSVAGYSNTVKGFKREDLTAFRSQYYQPANMLIVACGKIEKRDKFISLVKDVFSMPSAKKAFRSAPVKKIHKARHIRPFYKDIKQTHLAFGFHSMPRAHKMRYAITLLNIILGGNMSSRLFERLREKKALCYDVSSSVKRYKETGAFVIHAGVDNANLLEATGEIVHELNALKKNFVTSDELFRAKEYVKGQLLLALEDTASRMLWLGGKVLQEGKAPEIKEIFRNIEKVNVYDIKRVTNAIFDKKNLSFATIGPAREDIKRKLKKAMAL